MKENEYEESEKDDISDSVHQRFKELMPLYRQGDSEKKAAIYKEIIDTYHKTGLLYGFVAKKAKKWEGVAGEFEDLCQQAGLCIFENLEKYDPEESKPTTFFGQRILQSFKDNQANTHNISEHYQKIYLKIRRVLEKYEISEDIDSISPETIANLTGISVKTIRETLKQVRMKSASFDVRTDSRETAYDISPEDALIEKERSEVLKNAFNTLPPLEQYIVMHRYILADASTKALVERLNLPEMKERFGLRTVNTIIVQSISERAKRTLRSYPEFRRLIGMDDDVFAVVDTIYAQAETSDIEDAIMNNILEL